MDTVVEHKRFVAGIKIVGVFLKGAPHGAAGFIRVIELSPLKHAAVLIGLDTQVCFVPRFYFFRVFGFKKDAADSFNSFHISLHLFKRFYFSGYYISSNKKKQPLHIIPSNESLDYFKKPLQKSRDHIDKCFKKVYKIHMYFEREILETINAELDTPDILILLGSRQVGKTTILHMLKTQLEQEGNNCIFLDLDLETNLEYFSAYSHILDYIRLQGFDPVKDRIFLLLDEFQRVHGAGKTLKNLFDHHSNIKIIATGSSSLEINTTISESMSGRKIVFRVFPLNFREYLVFRGAEKLVNFYDRFSLGSDFSPLLYKEFQPYVTDKLIFGSFPGVATEKNHERRTRKIQDILNSYLRKDVKEQLRIRDTVQYKKVLELLGITIANLVNLNAIAGEVGAYYNKVKEIAHIAEETYIIDTLRPFFKNRKKEILRTPKVFFEDTGMRNFLVRNMNLDLKLRLDTGALVENFVYNELNYKLDVFSELKFWRTKSNMEINFLIVKNQEILPVEVKSGSHSNIPKTLLTFCQREGLSRAVILNREVSAVVSEESVDFYFVPYVFSARVPELMS